MKKVFISYGHENLQSARRLYQELSTLPDVEPWFDKESLLPGMKWRPAIRKAIRESDFFIALLSSQSTSRRSFAHGEVSEALEIVKEFPDDQTYLIPIRLDDCKIPFEEMREIQYVDFFPDWNKGLKKVLMVISRPLPEQEKRKKETTDVSLSHYKFKVGIVDLDVQMSSLDRITERLNAIQHYFQFTRPVLPSVESAVRSIGGLPNLAVYEISNSFFARHALLSVDLVACLTRYPLAFREGSHIVYNYFSGPSERDERFMFISTDHLYDFAERAGCTFEKAIVYTILGQLVVYFTDLGYHEETRGCVMDFCRNRADMVFGLKNMKFCSECYPRIQNPDLRRGILAILNNDFRF